MDKKDEAVIPALFQLNAGNIHKVKRWLDKDEKYGQDDNSQQELLKAFKTNEKLSDIFIKTVFINYTHSTQMRGQECLKIATYLLDNNVDNIIENGNYEKVADLIDKYESNRTPYSFITKYFSNSQRETYGKDDFPIFDNIVNDLINIFADQYYDFKSKIPKYRNYEQWYTILNEIKKYVNQTNKTGSHINFKDIDWYFWYLGRQIKLVCSAIHKNLTADENIKAELKNQKGFYLHSLIRYSEKIEGLTNKPKSIDITYEGNQNFIFSGNFIEDVLSFINKIMEDK